jgi:hypothetical protein
MEIKESSIMAMEMAKQLEENTILLCLHLANAIDLKAIKSTSNLHPLRNNKSSYIPSHLSNNQTIEPKTNKELEMDLKALNSHKIISKM